MTLFLGVRVEVEQIAHALETRPGHFAALLNAMARGEEPQAAARHFASALRPEQADRVTEFVAALARAMIARRAELVGPDGVEAGGMEVPS